MTTEYISGYLEAVSRVKDILTPYVGGTNQFFAISKDKGKSTVENLIIHLHSYLAYNIQVKADLVDKLSIEPIANWQDNLAELIKDWTCDSELESFRGRNGTLLSKYLVKFLLKDFFRDQSVEVYRLLPHWGDWPWGDHMSEEFLFETEEKIFIMHLGESS